ncbi:hypothetical protein K3152_08530 [Qipengyuania sp. 1NDH17]|uniref:Response regulatory domain-containing protein n=1 Tax=Qipengyuania polymorpha TaxID=2867234 RepID=A0ABS7J4C9_9SPHN|nr:hypothetical protein [Qipengyuania polymorpha]
MEDNPVLAYDTLDFLKEIGAEPVGPALDLRSGLELARRTVLDAALLDTNLGNGELVWPLAETLRQHNVPVIFISAECTRKYFPEAFQAFTCLEKPASNDEILDELTAALAA